MTEALGAEKGERSEMRLGHRSGYYSRFLITRIGKLKLRVPQDRQGEGARRFEIESSHAARSIEIRTPEGAARPIPGL
jgi:transposase-like protein